MYRFWCGISAIIIGNEIRKDWAKKDNEDKDDLFYNRDREVMNQMCGPSVSPSKSTPSSMLALFHLRSSLAFGPQLAKFTD